MLLLLLALLPFILCDAPEVDMCPLCVNTLDQVIDELLNIILNAGVIGGCGELCQMLAPKFGKIVAYACDIICDYAGIEVFIELIKKADLDPIWLCQEIKLCPIHDCTIPVCAKFTQPTIIRPNPARIGAEVQFMYKFQIFEQTGTGEILLEIETAAGSEPAVVEGGELVPKGYEKGIFQAALQATFKDDEQAEPPVIFRPGVYKTHFYICEGQCGSKHAHTRLLASQDSGFNMTQ